MIGGRLDANLSVMAFENFLGNGKAQAFASGFARIQPMKNLKYFRLMFGGYADAIVFHRVNRLAVLDPASDMDKAEPIWRTVFQGIIEEIGEDLVELHGITKAKRKFAHL